MNTNYNNKNGFLYYEHFNQECGGDFIFNYLFNSNQINKCE